MRKALTLQKVQKVFNEYIRLRDKDLPCISCQRYKIEQAGHFYSAGKYPALRFNESNVHGQCVYCNYHLHGNLIKYRIYLERRLGREKLDLLDSEATRKIKKFTQHELQAIHDLYKSKVKSMRDVL